MKLFILLIFLFSFQSNAKEVDTVLIGFGKNQEVMGSGLKLSFNNKSYVITNAHVCLGKRFHDKIKETDKFYYRVKTLNKVSDEVSLAKDMIIDRRADICIVPTIQKTKKVKFAGKLVGQHESVYYYTFNQSWKKPIKKEGMVLDYRRNVVVDNPFSKTKYVMPQAMMISTKTISGDSGSVVFNQQDELVGIIYAAGQLGPMTMGIMLPIANIELNAR